MRDKSQALKGIAEKTASRIGENVEYSIKGNEVKVEIEFFIPKEEGGCHSRTAIYEHNGDSGWNCVHDWND